MVESQKQNMEKRPRKKNNNKETKSIFIKFKWEKNVILKNAYLLCKNTKESNSYL